MIMVKNFMTLQPFFRGVSVKNFMTYRQSLDTRR